MIPAEKNPMIQEAYCKLQVTARKQLRSVSFRIDNTAQCSVQIK
jgi:hypothetical protein